MRFKAIAVGLVVAGTVLGASALSVGRLRGAVLIGQGLDLQIPLQLDGSAGENASCAEADVFHGDTRLEASRVQLRTEPGGPTDSVNLKISSPVPVDEPVVTVYLRVGCNQKTTRKYVLLAEYPGETAVPTARPGTPAPSNTSAPAALPLATTNPNASGTVEPAPGAAPLAATVSASGSASPSAATSAAAPAASAKSSPAVAAPVAKAVHKPAKADAPAPAEKAAAPGKPRLRLDPVETLAERVKALEASSVQSSVPDEVARDAQRMRQLEGDLKTLLDQAVKNEASLAAMRERLEKAETDRVPVWVVYGLVGTVALCLLALAWLWSRRNPAMRWQRNAKEPDSRKSPLGSL